MFLTKLSAFSVLEHSMLKANNVQRTRLTCVLQYNGVADYLRKILNQPYSSTNYESANGLFKSN